MDSLLGDLVLSRDPSTGQSQRAKEARSPTDKVPALTRAIAILNIIAQTTDGRTLASLSREIGAPKSSLLYICSALAAERLICRDENDRYKIGIRFAEFASSYLGTAPRLRSIGFLVQDLENPFFFVEAQAILEAAKQIGAMVHIRDGGKSPATQLRQIDDLIDIGVDVAIVDAIDPKEISLGIDALRKQNIPLVAVNVETSGADATVTTDNTQAGELVARHIGFLLNGSGRVAIIGGDLKTANDDRMRGFLSALRDFPSVQIVAKGDGEPNRATGHKEARRILRDYPDLDAIFGVNDPTSIGIVEALEEVGSKAAVLSVDGSAIVLDRIRTGRSIVATAAQNPRLLGQTAVRFAELLVSGGRLPLRNWRIPTMLITQTNADTYQTWD